MFILEIVKTSLGWKLLGFLTPFSVYEIKVPFFIPLGTLSKIVPVVLLAETKSRPEDCIAFMITQSIGS